MRDYTWNHGPQSSEQIASSSNLDLSNSANSCLYWNKDQQEFNTEFSLLQLCNGIITKECFSPFGLRFI